MRPLPILTPGNLHRQQSHLSEPRAGAGTSVAFTVSSAKAQAAHGQVRLQPLTQRRKVADPLFAGHLLSKELLRRTWLIHVPGPGLRQASLLSSWLRVTAACLLSPAKKAESTSLTCTSRAAEDMLCTFILN